jgi:alkanesulfonate monooxygenase SsuD/methylene tetrahydromethanopterin reductase-like flavin-dependent oxidoreductase (luciferase family)
LARRLEFGVMLPLGWRGTPEQIAEKMHALVDAGCRAFIPWCHDFPSDETLVRYATEVAPRLR